jgi:hypothetical protein
MTGDVRFGINELEVARTITNQASIALENARLYQSSVRMADRFAVLNETSSLVSASLNPEEVYVSVHNAAERLMPLDSFVITLLDTELRMRLTRSTCMTAGNSTRRADSIWKGDEQ